MDESDIPNRPKCSLLPQRVVFGIMGFFAGVVIFMMRSCLPVAITQMVVPVNHLESANRNDSLVCRFETSFVANITTKSVDSVRYNWSQEQQGYVLSSFFVGYLISHIPGGMLAEKFGGKWTLSLGVLLVIICNAITPLVYRYGEQSALIILIALRALMGIGAGPSFPALNVLTAAWVPQKETGKIATLIMSGGQLGVVLSTYLSGWLLTYWPWPVVFYFWSFIACIWFIAFILLCYNNPASHPFITKEERDYLKIELGQLKRYDDLPSTPWTKILTSVPIIVLMFCQFGSDWVYAVMANDMPKYMKDVLGMSAYNIGLYSSLPYLLLWIVSILSGSLCDFFISQKYMTVLQARKFFTTLSGVFPAVFVVAASYAECNEFWVIIYFILAMGFFGNYYPGSRCNLLDLSPNYAGSIMALINGFGSLSGIAAPTFVGIMTPDSTLEQWRFVFWFTFAASMSRTIAFLFWSSADIQPWNNPNESCKANEFDKLTDNKEIGIQSTEDSLIH